MKAGVVLDSWKLKIFKRRLDAAGYTYEQHDGPLPKTITLTVHTEDKEGLLKVLTAASTEAANVKGTVN